MFTLTFDPNTGLLNLSSKSTRSERDARLAVAQRQKLFVFIFDVWLESCGGSLGRGCVCDVVYCFREFFLLNYYCFEPPSNCVNFFILHVCMCFLYRIQGICGIESKVKYPIPVSVV